MIPDRGAEASRSWCVRSPCGRYRWLLARRWDRHAPWMLVVGLNPSTADALRDDPTTRRCIALAQRTGHGGLLLANLFGLRATRPADLHAARHPTGPANVLWRDRAAAVASTRVAAWGNHGRGPQADALLEDGAWWVLGWTALGAPRHPLYVRGDTPLQRVR
ncbi:MAG: DUF1643 domain-containing protein [Alphaproteobacteria bacterium]|nr:DUF1643 domain-containing protein [Alphaproteobacteria bacterium]